ncbi:heavy-metal-associated domain-containing protein [Flavobacterium sp. D11R37]|uniref:heavy-metal-associated domain-containing protein n=1 Tax=Flavobacterium coralii TaxID=2838017 RepID=UPI001CA62B08|nr:heavy-metal-associated domain-containing protein [Flavobacterium coralii]MBY8963108.1 heavy-metal-associated domain-containing protein [Flavobacterium coralii]
MKSILRSFLLIFTVLLCSSTVSAQEKKTIQTATIKTAIYCDHCKACETCGPKFNQALLKEKGVQMVVLDDKAMTIKVTYNSKKTDLAKIKTAISKLGYDADEVKADPVAYDGLDGCCKKA